MACTRPLRAVRIGDKVVIKKRADLLSLPDHDFGVFIDRATGEVCEPFDVPCGQCLQCRLDYARVWSERCMLEAASHEHNWFLTLTYDDYFLPYGEKDYPTLKPEDLTAFMKNLRERYSTLYDLDGIRFFGCGEYGDHTARPHYHLLVFGLPVPDIKLHSVSSAGFDIFTSDFLNSIWKKGFVTLGEVTYQSAAYTARYCQKKAGKDLPDYDALGIKKEFVRMSRRPGIGGLYYAQNADEIARTDKIYLPEGKISSSFRYFDRLAERDGRSLDLIKDNRRKRAELRGNLERELRSVDFFQHCEDMEDLYKRKARALKRNL